MNRTRLFVHNFFIYGFISGFGKMINLIMLPFMTMLLPDTKDFGINEMVGIVSGFGSQIALLGIGDAMFREYFEKEDKEFRLRVTSSSLNIVALSSILIDILMIIFCVPLSKLFFGNEKYYFVFIISALNILVTDLLNIIQAPTRMKNHRKIFIYSTLINSVFTYIPMFLLIKAGQTYNALIFSVIIGNIVSIIYFYILNKEHFNFKIIDKKTAGELFKIGLPLVPTFLIYWVFNSYDRIMVSNILGIDALGIYSVGVNLASVSQFIQLAWGGGWLYFAYTTMKDKEQVRIVSQVYEYMGIMSYLAFLIIMPFRELIFRNFVSANYFSGNEIFPFLFIAALVLMLFQIALNQLMIIKKAFLITLTLVLGAIFDLIFCGVFTKTWGIKGAALCTLISYIIPVIILSVLLIKMNLLKITKRFMIISAGIALINILIFFNIAYTDYLMGITAAIILFFYKEDIKFRIKVLSENQKFN